MDSSSLIDQLSLWNHQREAVLRMRTYISRYHDGEVDGSALVHMPTGSGKTGVIATLARCTPEIGCVLVLTPRIALREQLVRDIRQRFFQHLDKSPQADQLPKEVVELTGPFEDLECEQLAGTVFVSTIQKLRSMSRRNRKGFTRLGQEASLVLFDEGHYEPARTWSNTIRQLQAPTIIFTATPYRNDLKVFDLDLEHVYSYTYHQAVEDGYLREVRMVTRDSIQQPESFVEDVLEFYEQSLGNGLDESCRVIIRCDKRAAIRQIATVLAHYGYSFVAIHERFSDDDDHPHERQKVPDPQSEDAVFWIHQFKLLEGIDDPRFQLVAMFSRFGTARPLIQQIGRIIRNPTQTKGVYGYVLDHSGGHHAELWDGFRKYDATISQTDELELAVGHGWVPRLLDSQPGATYLSGRFRSQLDLDTLIPGDELILPHRVNLLRKLEGFDLDDLCGLIQAEYEEDDRLLRLYRHDEATAVFVYVAFRHSRFLKSTSFIEPQLGVTVVHEMSHLIAFYDSMGYVPLGHEEVGIGKPLSSASLKRLFRDHATARLTNVSLRNTNLGARSIRSKSISAAIVRDTVSGFDDHAQVCTTARGYSVDDPGSPVDSKVRRYVGFSRGRISDSSGQWIDLPEYIDWIEGIVALTSQTIVPVATFQRYAPAEVEIDDHTPLHILLDLFEVEQTYMTLPTDRVEAGQALDIEDRACEIEDGRFTLVANEIECEVNIEYDSDKKRYVLTSPALDGLYTNIEPYDTRGLLDYINREQSFRVVPGSENAIYVLGEFYRPIFKVGQHFDADEFEVGKILVTSPALGGVGSEKQPVLASGDGWNTSSLFGMIDELGKSADLDDYFGQPDILVCDDMGTEIADFLLADIGTNKVVFIHAKASSSRRPYSASALHDVCDQATKNINYLGMFNDQKPPGLEKWNGPWRSKGTRVDDRIRIGAGSGSDLWAEIRSIIRNPWAEREVWLFLGQILSKGQLEEHLASDPPRPEALQAAFLLHATMTNVASVGAKLRVFCYP